jgi:hypothetical protein
MGIKLDISEDYTIGQITFDCQSIDDVRKIGDILSIIGFNMRFANIAFREKTVPKELNLMLLKMDHYLYELQDYVKQIHSLYKTQNLEMPSNVEFVLTQFQENKLPAMRRYIEDISPADKGDAVTLLDFQYELSLMLLKEFEDYVDRIGSHLASNKKEETEKLRRLVNFRYVQEIRQIIHDAKRLNMLREHE